MRQFFLIIAIAVLLAAAGCDSPIGESPVQKDQGAAVANEAEPASPAENPPAEKIQAPQVVEASAAPTAAEGEVGDCPMKKAGGECGKDPADCPFHKAEAEKVEGCNCDKTDCPRNKAEGEKAPGCDCDKTDCPHHKAQAEKTETEKAETEKADEPAN